MELQTFLQSQGVSLRKPNSICLKKQSLDISCPMLSPSKIFSLRKLIFVNIDDSKATLAIFSGLLLFIPFYLHKKGHEI